MKTVLCFGTFDVLHPGHGYYFAQARRLGDRVVAVVARDRTVLEVKGQLPAMGEDERRRRVEEHEAVDEARLGSEGDKYGVVEEVRPHVILLGYDQQAFTERLADELARRGIEAEIHRAEAFEPHKYKTSMMRQTPLPEAVNFDEDALPI